MITVAGFNTAIDRRIDLDALRPGTVQRAVRAQALPGGKGLHVAQTVAVLGEPVRLVGLVDTAHAPLLRDHLRARNVKWHDLHTPHALRQCLAIHEADGQVTEILESGAELDAPLQQALLAATQALIDSSKVLVLSGSLPKGFDADAYARLVHEAAIRGVPCLLDASGDALRYGVDACPWLVKPNVDEASDLWGRPVTDVASAAACARWLQGRGMVRVVITLGADGAVGFDGKQAWHAALRVEQVRNTVGSGDCFMAGLAVSTARGLPLEDALRCAVACGAANAQGQEPGYVRKDQVDDLYAHVQMRRL
ncbi:MAG TPA: 1-phosphofructokinase family hexose kinase [Rhodanobacteraceae bacterium]